MGLWLGWVVAALAAIVAVSATLWALRVRAKSRATEDQLREALDHRGAHDDLTGLLNPFGLRVVGGGILNIARRDSDAASGCMIRVLPRAPGERAADDDVLTVAQAAQRSFRAGDAVARVDQDLVFVVGKGSGFPAVTLESRLGRQLSNFNVPGDPAPQLCIGCAVLNPWEDGDLGTLQQAAGRDLAVRTAARVVITADAVDLGADPAGALADDPTDEPPDPTKRSTDGPGGGPA
ncbi:MAG: Diguanylate cyclase, domain [Actinomycetota bacterium]